MDELHQRARSTPELVVEIHGTTRKVQCLSCDYRDDIEVALDRVRAGSDDPECPHCGWILKAATVSFGQSLDPMDLVRAERAAMECDLFLAVGTTLAVSPINRTALLAVQSGARLVIVNGEPTEFDALADVLVGGSISAVLPAICGMEEVNGPT